VGQKRKNKEVDDMGDLRGRIHVGKQDLNKLQTRKMKGLKGGDVETEEREEETEGETEGQEEQEEEQNRRKKKRRRDSD